MTLQAAYVADEDYKRGIKWRVELKPIRGELQRPPSQIWFCRTCGKIYARIEIVELETDSVIPYISIASVCEGHTRDTYYSIYTGGSILSENLNDIMELPAELVEKEFWIHLKEAERLIRLERLGNE